MVDLFQNGVQRLDLDEKSVYKIRTFNESLRSRSIRVQAL